MSQLPIVEITRHRLHSPHLSSEENKNIFGKCNNANGHGHNYTVDPRTGMVMNLTDLKQMMRQVTEVVDHKSTTSTAENIAVWFYDSLSQQVASLGLPNLKLTQIRLIETENNEVVYRGKLVPQKTES